MKQIVILYELILLIFPLIRTNIILFRMNMTFVSLSEVKKVDISWET